MSSKLRFAFTLRASPKRVKFHPIRSAGEEAVGFATAISEKAARYARSCVPTILDVPHEDVAVVTEQVREGIDALNDPIGDKWCVGGGCSYVELLRIKSKMIAGTSSSTSCTKP